jgi:uncharacterized membrane protein SpoIIM required for sporulation
MSPLQFEALYETEWEELRKGLGEIRALGFRRAAGVRGERIACLYRRACEQLALARARSYPSYLTARLEQLTADAHQLIYQRPELGLSRLARFVATGFPRAVRAHASYVAVSLAAFALPALVLGILVYFRPELVLTVVDAQTAAGFEEMYSDDIEVFGRRSVQSDWQMFAYYIANNIGIAYQCFGSGLLAGAGSLFFIIVNAAYAGAVAGYLTERGHAANFYSFIVTHSAFELTAIVLAGAAGLRIGHALLAPKRHTRRQALVVAARECIPIMYGVTAMLLVAAAIEAFWSAAAWIRPLPQLRYTVAAVCWAGVLAYLARQGRRAG